MESKGEFKKLILKVVLAFFLMIRLDEMDWFIKIYDGIRYLVLFGRAWYDGIYSRIRYLISEKSGVVDSINHNFARNIIDLYNSLPIKNHWLFIIL